MSPSARLALWGSASIPWLGGCTRHWSEGDTTHYAYPWWASGGVLLLGLAVVVIGFLMRGVPERLRYLLTFSSLLLLTVFVPELFLEHVAVNSDGFSMRSGRWFLPDEHHVKFGEVHTMALTSMETRNRRGRTSTSDYLECQTLAGTVEVPMGSLMESALREILLLAMAQDIPIDNRRGGEIPEPPVLAEAPSSDDLAQLIEKLSSRHKKTCEQASRALVGQGAAAVGPLTSALESGNPKVRFWAAHTLGGIGPAAAAAGDKLVALSDNDPDANVRYYAAAALRRVKP